MRIPFDDDVATAKQKEIHKRRAERSEIRQRKIQLNKENYFQPAAECIFLSETAMDYISQGKNEDAIEIMWAALDQFQEKFSSFLSSNLYFSLYFNLGKVLVDNGFTEEGLEILIDYCNKQKKDDYYRSELVDLLQLEFIDIDHELKVKSGSWNNVSFLADSENKLSFTKSKQEMKALPMPLPYRVPVSIQVESQDKTNIELFDYEFITKCISFYNGSIHYELSLPLKYYHAFFRDFIGTLNTYENVVIKEIQSFEELKTKYIIGEKRLSYQQHILKDINLLERIQPLAFLTIDPEYDSMVFDDISNLIEELIINETTDEQIDEIELEQAKRELELMQKQSQNQLKGEKWYDYDYHRNLQHYYGELHVYVHNLENNIQNPFETPNKLIYRKYARNYWGLLGEIFSDLESTSDQDVFNYEIQFNNCFHDEILNEAIDEKWQMTIRLLRVDTAAAMVKIRLMIEELVTAIAKKKEIELNGINELVWKLKKIEWTMSEEIKKELIKLRVKANSAAHYLELSQDRKDFVKEITVEEVELSLKRLNKAFDYYINHPYIRL